MILDSLANGGRYLALNPLFAAAMEFLRRADLASLPEGRHEIQGDRLFALVARAQGKGAAGAKLEVHRKYIDIQYVVSGTEVIGWRAIETCRQAAGPFDQTKDIGFFADPADSWVTVPAGHLAILLPHDAHAPLAGSGPLHKVILKVAV